MLQPPNATTQTVSTPDDTSPADAYESAIRRMEELNLRYRALVSIYPQALRWTSAPPNLPNGTLLYNLAVEKRLVILKDIIDIQGQRTGSGSACFQQHTAAQTATLVQRLWQHGAITAAKAHCTEFAFGAWGTNAHLGTPLNPWSGDQPLTPGGSSSGCAVALAVGMAPFAVGTDTGGSARLPAAWCGLTTLKTSHGRISRHGVLMQSPSFDTISPMARSAKDVGTLYRVLTGPDPNDPATLDLPPASSSTPHALRGMLIGRPPAGQLAGVCPDILANYERSLEDLAAAGANIRTLQLPHGLDEVSERHGRLVGIEAYRLLGHFARDNSLPLDAAVRQRLLASEPYLDRYHAFMEERAAIYDKHISLFYDIDILVMPTTAHPPIPLADIEDYPVPTRLTRYANFFNLAVLALPNGFTSAGLPTSIQFMAPPYEEERVLAAGTLYQQLTAWHLAWPQASKTRDSSESTLAESRKGCLAVRR